MCGYELRAACFQLLVCDRKGTAAEGKAQDAANGQGAPLLLMIAFKKAYVAGLRLADQYQSGPPRRLDPPLGPGLDPPLAQAPRYPGSR